MKISQLLPEKFREQRILIYFKGEKGEVNDPDLKLAYDTFEQWKLKCNHDKKGETFDCKCKILRDCLELFNLLILYLLSSEIF